MLKADRRRFPGAARILACKGLITNPIDFPRPVPQSRFARGRTHPCVQGLDNEPYRFSSTSSTISLRSGPHASLRAFSGFQPNQTHLSQPFLTTNCSGVGFGTSTSLYSDSSCPSILICSVFDWPFRFTTIGTDCPIFSARRCCKR